MSLFRKKSPTPEEQAFQSAISEQFERVDDDDDDGEAAAVEPDIVIEDDDDGVTRIDFGAIKVPGVDGMELRAELDDQEQVIGVAVMIDDTVLQLQAFAAPKSERLWDEVRQEIAEGIRGSQGKAREVEGPFGRELHAEVVVVPDDGPQVRQPVRFIGRDGERWFLRGVVTGAGAADPSRAEAVESVFDGVRVVRGSHAAPPRDPLPLTLPDNTPAPSEQDAVDDQSQA